MLLALDSSVGSSVAVLTADERVLAERSVEDSRRHAEVIGDLIVECLAAAGATAREVTAVAVGMGPGPFTGLRVGIAAANAFALARAVPVLRVVSHDAIALERLERDGTPLLVTTDARRRERYFSAYSGLDAGGIPVRVLGPDIGASETIDGVTREHGYGRVDADRVPATGIGVLALRIRKHHRQFAAAEPLYLRSPDVTVPSARKRVST